MKKQILPALVLALIAAAAIGCGDEVERKGFDRTPIVMPDSCIPYEFAIDSLPYERRPNTNYGPGAITNSTSPTDPLGVVMYRRGDAVYYHPVDMAHRSLALLDLFHDTGDSLYLASLKHHVNRLLREGIEIDGALYFPYNYDNYVNQQEDGLLTAPWYSGMAQGEILGVLTRTFLTTGDTVYLEAAHRTFKTMLRPQGEATPWTVFVDSLGCYWIEEYPTEDPSKTLNGFIFAVYGVYDYYLLTGDLKAERVLQQSLSTVRNYLPSFRRPGRPSFYGLRFGHFSGEYHMIHINQLRMLQRISGDAAFGAWADTLAADYTE